MSIFPANGIKKVSVDVDELLHRKTMWRQRPWDLGAMAERRRPEQHVLPYEGKLAYKER
jgi:hypothetical protein